MPEYHLSFHIFILCGLVADNGLNKRLYVVTRIQFTMFDSMMV